jgi:hypothetical protein
MLNLEGFPLTVMRQTVLYRMKSCERLHTDVRLAASEGLRPYLQGPRKEKNPLNQGWAKYGPRIRCGLQNIPSSPRRLSDIINNKAFHKCELSRLYYGVYCNRKRNRDVYGNVIFGIINNTVIYYIYNWIQVCLV